jgi:Zn-dependent protease with chaperone function
MGYLDGQLTVGRIACSLLPPVVLLILPITVSQWYRRRAFQKSEEDRTAIWFEYRGLGRFVVLTTLAVWWALWDLHGGWLGTLKMVPSWLSFLSDEDNRHLLFWILPITSLFLLQLLNFSTDKTVSGLHWSSMAILRRAWWSVVQNVISILMVAAGFEAIYAGRYIGILWLVGAAVIHRIGLVLLRLAEGMRFNRLKSGELRNRSLAIARKMGIKLNSVCILPAGKGHLTNAFGASNMIALSDALPKYLNERQVDSVIAHELIHVKRKHARMGSLIIVASFSALMLLMFKIPERMMQFRPLFNLAVVYLPMIGFYYSSRRAEFEADREAVLYTGDPETSIRALVNLYQTASVPVRCSKLNELFQTHPSLIRRVLAIAQVGELPNDRVSKLLKETGLLAVVPDRPAEIRS